MRIRVGEAQRLANSRLGGGQPLAVKIGKRLMFDYLGVEDNSTVERLLTMQRYPRVVLVIMHEIVLLLRGHAWPSFIRLCSSSLAETLYQILSFDIIVPSLIKFSLSPSYFSSLFIFLRLETKIKLKNIVLSRTYFSRLKICLSKQIWKKMIWRRCCLRLTAVEFFFCDYVFHFR